jgi:hypothetical protein
VAGEQGTEMRRAHPRTVVRGYGLVPIGIASVVLALAVVTVFRPWSERTIEARVRANGGGVSVGALEPWNPRRAADYLAARRAHVTWLRGDLSWRWLEPRRGEWDWSLYDPVVADARRAGLHYLAILHTVPGWANGDAGDYAPPTDTALLGDYCYRTARHYLPLGVTDYEIGNEVNLPHPGWPDASGARYAERVLLPCAAGVRRAAAESGTVANVMLGALAPTGATGGADPAGFLTDVYRHGGRGLFDSVSWHPYTGAAHPAVSRQMNTEPDRLHAVMAAHGDGGKKVWATEFGRPTAGPDSTSERAQAALVDQALDAWYAKAYAGPLLWYSLRDLGTSETDREEHFGLLRHDGTPKPALAAVGARLRR